MHGSETLTTRPRGRSIRTRVLATVAVVAAAAVTALAGSAGRAAAAGPVAYTLTGYEVASSPATFLGVWQAAGVGAGTWTATILHDALKTSPNKTTAITGGGFALGAALTIALTPTPAPFGFSFAFTPASTVAGAIDAGGQLVARPAVGASQCTQVFAVGGTLNGANGSFTGLLTHYGTRAHGVCDASQGFASFRGTLTLP